ncbi:hypothetical protein LOK49_LG04G00841 [Camellia lanceoleosa]|uniref:Uncharacterized protein n=1 Tax=Camellia lanceoleosa TaxID=1840588 RepID=A0ACC0HV33_9ERIC|nr:hypothetical protein LOK49_LG04G00841 [Camellia lanceoleosa]
MKWILLVQQEASHQNENLHILDNSPSSINLIPVIEQFSEVSLVQFNQIETNRYQGFGFEKWGMGSLKLMGSFRVC